MTGPIAAREMCTEKRLWLCWISPSVGHTSAARTHSLTGRSIEVNSRRAMVITCAELELQIGLIAIIGLRPQVRAGGTAPSTQHDRIKCHGWCNGLK